MSVREAMETQRAIRRLRPDPVDDDILLRCLELALKAPTGGNAQTWEWIVVRDPAVKADLAKLYRRVWAVYGRAARAVTRNDDRRRRAVEATQWQVDHFEDVPVVVVACLRGSRLLNWSPAGAATFYGSIFPAVQNFLLACRAEGLGAALTTLPTWSNTLLRRVLGLPFGVQPVAVIPVGWPKGRYGPTTRRPLHEVMHRDRWGRRDRR
ncbi:MAG: nitroreductase family protein [Actinomycetota bacterium]